MKCIECVDTRYVNCLYTVFFPVMLENCTTCICMLHQTLPLYVTGLATQTKIASVNDYKNIGCMVSWALCVGKMCSLVYQLRKESMIYQ